MHHGVWSWQRGYGDLGDGDPSWQCQLTTGAGRCRLGDLTDRNQWVEFGGACCATESWVELDGRTTAH